MANPNKKYQSSYQTLKNDFEYLRQEYIKIKKEKYKYRKTLLDIALLKDPQVVEAPRKALEALKEYEEE